MKKNKLLAKNVNTNAEVNLIKNPNLTYDTKGITIDLNTQNTLAQRNGTTGNSQCEKRVSLKFNNYGELTAVDSVILKNLSAN